MLFCLVAITTFGSALAQSCKRIHSSVIREFNKYPNWQETITAPQINQSEGVLCKVEIKICPSFDGYLYIQHGVLDPPTVNIRYTNAIRLQVASPYSTDFTLNAGASLTNVNLNNLTSVNPIGSYYSQAHIWKADASTDYCRAVTFNTDLDRFYVGGASANLELSGSGNLWCGSSQGTISMSMQLKSAGYAVITYFTQ
ncbi:MAG: hypothetical protein DCC75_03260 [Proteobacteria bacterium]|nr:MAG: hypothetical protein DCC75_03260 [Pseudomonadota bacterium]